jgi:hypothetical protein
MANPQIDSLIQAFMWKALPLIVLASIAGLLIREALQWLERKAKNVGRSRQAKRDALPSTTRRVFTPFSSHPAPQPSMQPTPPPPPSIRPQAPPSVRPPEAPPPPLALTVEDLNWKSFELLAGEIFRRRGFEVEISSGLGADGGKDLTLRQGSEVRLVQCKRLSAQNKVSVMEMRQFYGLLVAEKATCGIFMTTGLYSRDAREFAEGKPIKLLGLAEIEQLMASVARPGENLCNVKNWISEFAAVANVTDPDCPRCRRPMRLRRGPTGRAFWGCSSYAKTRCRGKRDARTELVQEYSYQRS